MTIGGYAKAIAGPAIGKAASAAICAALGLTGLAGGPLLRDAVRRWWDLLL